MCAQEAFQIGIYKLIQYNLGIICHRSLCIMKILTRKGINLKTIFHFLTKLLTRQLQSHNNHI